MAEAFRAIASRVLREQAQKQRTLMTIQRDWATLVGRQLAGHTKAVSLRRGRLVVHADQPGDNFALSYRRAPLLRQLQRKTKGLAILLQGDEFCR